MQDSSPPKRIFLLFRDFAGQPLTLLQILTDTGRTLTLSELAQASGWDEGKLRDRLHIQEAEKSLPAPGAMP
jgi:hypothetical protein